jgi:uncharacterized YigZ family protein
MILDSSDEYLTIKGRIGSKTKVQGSVFIATAVPVDSEQSAQDWVGRISSEFFDATHNCFAVRVKQACGDFLRFSDAGEPRGTAGKPILSAIEAESLYNVLVVVTRYFGGVKLGTGGLTRAYRQAAQSALKQAEKIKKQICSEIRMAYPLSMTGKVSQVFSRFEINVQDRGFEKQATARILVRASLRDRIREALVEATNGQVTFE